MDSIRAKATFLVVMVVLSVLGGSHGFLNFPEGQQFLRSYCNAFRYTDINIFLPKSVNRGTISAGVLRALWTGSIRRVSVRRVDDTRQVSQILDDDPSASINVGVVREPGDLQFYTKEADQSVIRNYPWLMFGNIQEVLSEIDKPYLILDNQVTFASYDNATKTMELLEAYNVDRYLEPKIQRLGQWEEGGQLEITKKPWVQRRSNLTGLHLKCTTLGYAPFLYLSEPGDELNVKITGGFAGDVWHTLQDNLGFTYSCRRPADGLWGHQTDGVWNGLVKDLLDGTADVVVTALDHSASRVGAISFVSGLREIGYQLVVRRPGLMERTWTSFTSELVPASWIATIAFALLVPPCLSLCASFSPGEEEKISLKDAYILTLGAFTTQGSWVEVKSISTRIVFITIFMATLLVYAHYTSALVSLLTVASTTTRITSLQNLLEDGTYTFGFMRDISIQDAFETSQSGLFHDVWKQLVKGNPANLPTEDSLGVRQVTESAYVHMIEENNYRAEFSGMCGTVMIKGKYFTQQTGFAVAKGSPLKEILNAQLMRMRDGGILSRLWETWQLPPPLCTIDNVVALDINQLFTAFLLLVLGLLLAIVFLPCERLHWSVIGKDKAFRELLMGPPKKIMSDSTDVRFFSPRIVGVNALSAQGRESNHNSYMSGISSYFTRSNNW